MIHFECLLSIGSPEEFFTKYSQHWIDELIFNDSVASLYKRNHLKEQIQQLVNQTFVTLTVVGGIRSLKEDVGVLFHSGVGKMTSPDDMDNSC